MLSCDFHSSIFQYYFVDIPTVKFCVSVCACTCVYVSVYVSVCLCPIIIVLFCVYVLTVLAELGDVELKYDMRHIGEIISFLAAWRGTRLVDKLFLGKPSQSESREDSDVDVASVHDEGE